MGSLILVSNLTFGRDSARYWELIAVLAGISVVLWLFVVATTLIRLTARLMWYRRSMRIKAKREG